LQKKLSQAFQKVIRINYLKPLKPSLCPQAGMHFSARLSFLQILWFEAGSPNLEVSLLPASGHIR
jgi:hypothetical protein